MESESLKQGTIYPSSPLEGLGPTLIARSSVSLLFSWSLREGPLSRILNPGSVFLKL